MISKTMKTSEHMLSTISKTIAAHEHCQVLTNDAAELIWYDNNDWKVKHDCLKKLSILNIW